MKKMISMGAAWLLVATVPGFAADLKLGVVNLQKIFEEYHKTKQADSTLKEAADAYNKERQQLIGEFQKLQEDRNKLMEEINKPELSAKAKEEKTKEAETKLTDLRKQKESIDEFDRVRRQQLQDQSNRMRANIVKEITDHVVKIAKGQGFSLVIDSSGSSMNGTPLLVYFDEKLEVTREVINELNRGAPAIEPPKPTAPAKTNEPAAK